MQPDEKPQWKSAHFWLTVLAVIVGGLAEQTVYPMPDRWHKAILCLGAILGLFGYQLGVRWTSTPTPDLSGAIPQPVPATSQPGLKPPPPPAA